MQDCMFEKEDGEYVLFDEASKQLAIYQKSIQALEQAESERNSLASELAAEHERANTARSTAEQQHARWVETDRQLAEALARVKELERQLQHAADVEIHAANEVKDRQIAEDAQCAAETALASARKSLSKNAYKMPVSVFAEVFDALTSHPAPVAILPPVSESDEAIVGALIAARTQMPKPMAAPVADTFGTPVNRTTTASDLDAVWPIADESDEADAVPEDGSAVGPIQLRTRAQIDAHIASEIRAWRKAVAEGTRHPMSLNYITVQRLQELCDEPESPVAAPCASETKRSTGLPYTEKVLLQPAWFDPVAAPCADDYEGVPAYYKPCAGCAELRGKMARAKAHLKPAGSDACHSYNLVCIRKALEALR